ncbi:MAG: 2-oxoglutarate dehydrogenase, E2 component, dihydrolipoamide succinyltransferase [Acidobacteriaceae bacterium]
MPTDVVMPQMGESIVEGTITKWLKKPGDSVQQDEPLFEISTDKVDAEIPSPAAGTLLEIKVPEGATVQINTVVAVIAAKGEAASKPEAAPAKPVPAAAAPANSKAVPAPAPAAAEKLASAPAPAVTVSSGGTEVVMPQMGESIVEGTITKWLKKVGDKVQQDEPLFEISTDKVDAEIPSPAAGTLTEIKVPEGATVQINTVVAVLGGTGAAARPAPTATPSAPAASNAAPATAPVVPTPVSAPDGASGRIRSSPLVRRMAKDHNLDLSKIAGTGAEGRITKDDVLAYLDQQGKEKAAPTKGAAPSVPIAVPSGKAPVAPAAVPMSGDLVPMSKMRSIIAHRMVESKHVSAHVHSVFKVDMTRIARIREREKAKYEQRNGVKLTYMPFIARAAVHCLRKMPIVNASVEGDALRYHQNINIGIAVALDWGLIVPVIQQAEERSFLGLARAIADVAARARSKKLMPDEVTGGTFTITNPGIFGEQFGLPVINQPETAILSVGGLFKEPMVLTDAEGHDSIAIRHVLRLTLGFDHRAIDGADGGKFLAEMKRYLEDWDEEIG